MSDSIRAALERLHQYAEIFPVHDTDAILAAAHAALAEQQALSESQRYLLARWGHQPTPPAEGEVAEFITQLKSYAEYGTPIRLIPFVITRAAELLQQQEAEIKRLRAQQTPVPVSERLPEPNTKVLAHYFNALGNGRTICAIWVPAKSRSEDSGDDDFTEYDEENDTYYWPEGWYEAIENWDDLGWVAVNEGEVAYWQPLPDRKSVV